MKTTTRLVNPAAPLSVGRLYALLLGFGLLGAMGCGNPTPVELAGKTMGTTYSVKLTALPAGITAEQLQREIDDLLEAINNQMSTYRPKSELSLFNASVTTDWFPVSKATTTVVQHALELSEKTGGAFDVTVAPLVNLWNFGPERTQPNIPDTAEILVALGRTGWREIEARTDPPALKKARAELTLDLSAIAKGYAVDAVAELLSGKAINNYLVEIGGEVRTTGTKTDGSNWVVGINKPDAGLKEIDVALELSGLAMATSGDYRNFFEVDGQRYSHTIDPRTGKPIESLEGQPELASVSVITDSCMHADAIATALMVLGPEHGYNFAVEENLAVFFHLRSPEGMEKKTTPAFEKLKTVVRR